MVEKLTMFHRLDIACQISINALLTRSQLHLFFPISPSSFVILMCWLVLEVGHIDRVELLARSWQPRCGYFVFDPLWEERMVFGILPCLICEMDDLALVRISRDELWRVCHGGYIILRLSSSSWISLDLSSNDFWSLAWAFEFLFLCYWSSIVQKV